MSNKKKQKVSKNKAKSRKTVNFNARNTKVAQNRGKNWRKNLMTSKLRGIEKPSLLKQRRVNAGLSQEVFIKRVRFPLSIQSFSRVEQKNRSVSEKEAKRMASQLKVPFSRVFTRVADNSYMAR